MRATNTEIPVKGQLFDPIFLTIHCSRERWSLYGKADIKANSPEGVPDDIEAP
jgi:hypothetical protein